MLKLKICGLRRVKDIDIVNKYNIDYIGFVFAKSPRQVSFNQAKELSGLLKEDIIPVGVFVNEDLKFIVDLFKEGIIEIAQLHGDEDEKYIQNLKSISYEITGREIKVIKSIEIKNNDENNKKYDDNNQINNDIDFNEKLLEWRDSVSDYFILDSGKGSGNTFNWNLIDKDNEMLKKPFFLAGGLNSENIGLAIKEFNPYAVDLSSGVETEGFKDEEKIKQIVEILEKYRK
ncbi:phosphoribosylanthranilate isomerase [Methanobrevibacter olleyae]|uniref:N-(5'-phosphoribosyl)anthranilate isomerase n=1 Tax=Methanobrevibacter olleyae TaxID=294671 RepID=A0A126R3X8_METOL|nr:phosphoribosylanthranilate isomerase [Methanobrevibacter olleyae]AMK16385.1 phosphoribosylanthranilate isomerase TrpF [Methanobrevibacter olleyae]SFL50383.1 phosphoribosylanthranilate isomerase [Methanobrevibacter olleyae]